MKINKRYLNWEDIEDLIDISTIKVKRDRKYLNPDCDI